MDILANDVRDALVAREAGELREERREVARRASFTSSPAPRTTGFCR